MNRAMNKPRSYERTDRQEARSTMLVVIALVGALVLLGGVGWLMTVIFQAFF